MPREEIARRVLLIHWSAAEAGARAAPLRKAGYAVECLAGSRPGLALRQRQAPPPDAIVIDLGRAPSLGHSVGLFLRSRKATRAVPLLFTGGDPERNARIRETIPGAVLTGWKKIRSALRGAIRNLPAEPAARAGVMDLYRGRPLAGKLGLRAGSVVSLLGAPAGFEQKLGNLPEGVSLRRDTRREANTILLFASDPAGLDRRFAPAVASLAERGGIWICWRKHGSAKTGDLTQAAVRAYGLARGFVDYKICSVDDTWSGLLFARRRV